MESLQKIVYSQVIQLRKQGISEIDADRFFQDKYRITLRSVAEKNNLNFEEFMENIKGHPYSPESVKESVRLVYELEAV